MRIPKPHEFLDITLAELLLIVELLFRWHQAQRTRSVLAWVLGLLLIVAVRALLEQVFPSASQGLVASDLRDPGIPKSSQSHTELP